VKYEAGAKTNRICTCGVDAAVCISITFHYKSNYLFKIYNRVS